MKYQIYGGSKMLKMRVLAITLATAVIASMGVGYFTASAASVNGTIVNVNGEKLKVMTGFDELAVGTTAGKSDQKYMNDSNYANGTSLIDIQADGVDGSNGLCFEVPSTVSGSSSDGLSFDIRNWPDPHMNFVGANAVGFWINTKNAKTARTLNVVWGEYDHDANGNIIYDPTNESATNPKGIAFSFRNIKNDASASFPFYLQDSTGAWKEYSSDKAANTITIPAGYEGYVKIPFSSMALTWGSDDVNNKYDMLQTFYFCLTNGDSASDLKVATDPAIVFDNIGFFGDVTADTTATSSVTSTSSNTINTTSSAATTSDSTTTSSQKSSNPNTGDAAGFAVFALAAAAFATGTALKHRFSKH